ncbi:terminase large subunit domain-containing protein [Nocardioides jejuensis]|nr:terminase family protein [Nocardioides jejuensis]
MVVQPLTQPSTPRLSEVAKHVVVPSGVVSTGWPAVEAKCADMGIRFRWWQKPIGQILLGKRADGKYAATIGGTGLAIPRQVGKTFLIGAIVFALCLLRPNLTVIWSAHRLRTAEETFKKMQAMARKKAIKPFVKKVTLGSGEECIEFVNGSRIMFGARAAGFGRGFDEVDVVVYDEAQILDQSALDDMVPAMNQSRQPDGALLLFMGTPPTPKDPSEVFLGLRADALSGKDEDTGWIEFGAADGYKPPPVSEPMTEADWVQVARANPSFPEDTSREAILRMRKRLGYDSYCREGLGIFDELNKQYAFGAGKYEACAVEDPGPVVDAIALAVSFERNWGSIGAAGQITVTHEDSDGNVTEVDAVFGAAVERREGTGWLVPEAWRLHKKYAVPIVVSRSAKDLIPALEAVGFVLDKTLIKASTDDNQNACSQIYERVRAGTFAHANHDDLDNSVYGAHRKTQGNAWVWDPKNSETDVAMLEAVTLAAWQAALVSPDYDVLASVL